jgi:hypothetical protein
VTDKAKHELDESDILIVDAWNLRKSKDFRESKRERRDENKSWDYYIKADEREAKKSKGQGLGLSGCNVPVDYPTKEARSIVGAPATNTSTYMTGKVAVGVVIVDGPANTSASLTNQEVSTIIAEVQEGANSLINLSPQRANLSFVYDIRRVRLDLNPSNVTGEENWRDPAMTQLGYASGSSGLYDYIEYLRTRRWCKLSVNWAYIAFFTKYNVSWFAYASIGGPRLVMQYGNNGWGPNQIDRVFAHETGHIFGAPDEYSSSNCNTGGSWGYLGVSNCNCEVGNPSSVNCLMKGNTYDVCQCTIGHFGWRDSDRDGIPDPLDKISYDVRTFRPWAGYAIPNGLWLPGDFNGDGRDDILHAVANSDYTHPWLSKGDGTFDVKTFRPWAGYAIPNGLWLVGDFNGDGRDDILHAVAGTDYVHLWQSRGDGTFDIGTFRPWAGYAIPNGLWLPGDFNGDKRYDILHAVANSDYTHPWLSNGR